MKILNFKACIKKYNLKNDTMNESHLQRVYNYRIYPRDSKLHSDKGFVNIDAGRIGGSQWICFLVKDNKSNCFDRFGGQRYRFLLKQLPKSKIYHIYKKEDIYSKLSGSYCLYFIYLIERMKYFDSILRRYFNYLNIPINAFGNSSNIIDNKIDTSLFVQNFYLRSNYIEANIEEDIDLKNEYKYKNLSDPTNLQEACSKNYFDNLFNDPSIIKDTEHTNLNDRSNTNARFIQVNELFQTDSHLTAKLYVDIAIDESSFLEIIKIMILVIIA